jgi:hypothetical protein
MIPSVVYVRWRDSLVGEAGWSSIESVHADAQGAFDGPLSAAGFLVVDEPTHIAIATGYNPHTDEVQGSLMIPRSEVVSVDELRGPESQPTDSEGSR